MWRSLVLLPIIFGLPAHGIPFGAQETNQAAFRQEVRVVYKLIQVTVTGGSGDPVADLAKGDFELTDNGKPVVIEHFERHSGGPKGTGAGDQAVSPGFTRRYFLVFDFGIIHPNVIKQVIKAALRFLDKVAQPADEIAVISFSVGAGLRVHEYLTNDQARIRRAISTLASGTYFGRADSLAQYWVRSNEKGLAAVGAGRPTQGQEYADTYMEAPGLEKDGSHDLLNISLQFSHDMRTLARSLRYVPGIKNVILFSEGTPRELLYGKKGPAPLSMSEWSLNDGGVGLAAALRFYDATLAPQQNVLDAHQAMMRELRTSNCPVYCIDTARPKGIVDIENVEIAPPLGNESFGRAILSEISENTGGDLLGRASQPEMIVRAARRLMGTVYILGYPVADTWDGRYHRVKVKVLRKGCKIAAQAGYYNPKPYSEYSTDDKLFQLMDLALSDNPQFLSAGGSLPFVAFPVWDRGRSYMAGIVRIPVAKSAEGLGRDAETFLLLLNERRDIISITSFDFGERRPAEGTIDARFVIPTKPGRYSVRFVVRNRISGWGARGNAALTVPDASAATAWFDPPLLLTASKGVAQSDAPLAATLAPLYPYDAGSFAPALGAVPVGTEKFYAVLRCPANMSDAEISITASLSQEEDPEGFKTPISVLNEIRQGTTRVLFIEIPGRGLAPGAYNLKFSVREKNGFVSGTTGVAFRIQ
jgi:VWFA-related protein